MAALETVVDHERTVRRRVGIAWGLLLLDTLTYTGALVPIPSAVGKLITQGALPLAILVLLTINRQLVLRPNVFLGLATLLVIEASVTSLQPRAPWLRLPDLPAG